MKDQPLVDMVKCKVWKRKFKKKSILNHIAKSVKCNKIYYPNSATKDRDSSIYKPKRRAKYYQKVRLKVAEEYSSKKAEEENSMVADIERINCIRYKRNLKIKSIFPPFEIEQDWKTFSLKPRARRLKHFRVRAGVPQKAPQKAP